MRLMIQKEMRIYPGLNPYGFLSISRCYKMLLEAYQSYLAKNATSEIRSISAVARHPIVLICSLRVAWHAKLDKGRLIRG
jgi:hypothetical protein